MDINLMITDYISFTILAICLCVGYIIKHSLDFIPNKYIPLIVGMLGLICSIVMTKDYTLEVILTGLVSGLSSTGFYEAFCNLIDNENGNE